MGLLLSLFFIPIIILSAIKKNHKLNIFLSIFSLVCDTFYINVGGLNFLLIYFIAYLNIPFLINNNIIRNKTINWSIKYLKNEYIYLIILGVIFGFIFPWKDFSSTRLWNQTAQGRTIVQLFRLFSEFLVLYYVALLLITEKINLRYIVMSFAIASVISFWVGFFDFFTGYTLKTNLFDLERFETRRFLGLNGEPKALGRVGALSYAIILLYLIHFRNRSSFLIFALITNVLAVILSSSASSYIFFLLANIIIFLNFRIKNIVFASIAIVGLIFTYNGIQSSSLLEEGTSEKINKALLGSDGVNIWIKNEPTLFTRFDIWDRLALIYLYQNPKYLITGVGPNLICIPMSNYIPVSSSFYTLGRVDSVPNVMLINILARSGLIGVILFFLTIYRILIKSYKKLSLFYTKIFIIFILFNMVIFNATFYLIIGILVGTLALTKR